MGLDPTRAAEERKAREGAPPGGVHCRREAPMTRYQKYINSEEWVAKRKLVLERARGRCEVCRHAKATQVHHLTYKNLGDEPLEDLQAVCLSCHAGHHPDKLDGRFIPVVEAGCEMCPNEMVEVFWEDRTCRTFCPRCGHSTTSHFPKRKRRPKSRPPGWLEEQRKAERAETRRLKREEREREVRDSFTPGKASGLYRCLRCDAQVNVKRRQSHFRQCRKRCEGRMGGSSPHLPPAYVQEDR